MKEITTLSGETAGRKTLLAALGLGLLSLFSFRKWNLLTKKDRAIACAPPVKKETMKFLGQDGRLVEVDISNIKTGRQKVSDKELREWIKK